MGPNNNTTYQKQMSSILQSADTKFQNNSLMENKKNGNLMEMKES